MQGGCKKAAITEPRDSRQQEPEISVESGFSGLRSGGPGATDSSQASEKVLFTLRVFCFFFRPKSWCRNELSMLSSTFNIKPSFNSAFRTLAQFSVTPVAHSLHFLHDWRMSGCSPVLLLCVATSASEAR